MGDVDKNENTIKFPGSEEYLAAVDDFLESWLRAKGVPEDTIADMAIAVTELVNNAIKYGSKKNTGNRVILTLYYGGGEIKASVIDQGVGFDPDKIPSPIEPENLMKEIGRGIFIVRSLMDDVAFSFPSEGGTQVTITKKYNH